MMSFSRGAGPSFLALFFLFLLFVRDFSKFMCGFTGEESKIFAAPERGWDIHHRRIAVGDCGQLPPLEGTSPGALGIRLPFSL